jgi:hypothetical protein
MAQLRFECHDKNHKMQESGHNRGKIVAMSLAS